MEPTAITALPLFPLGATLFPGGRLPLRIFEVRYLSMIGKCQRDGSPFGVVGLLEGDEVATPAADGSTSTRFHRVGTLAHISRFDAPMPGLMEIDCAGGVRFHIENHQQLPHGLWVGDVTTLAADAEVDIPSDLAPVAQKLGSLIRSLQQRGVSVEQMPITPPFELEDCGWVANRWSELLPLPADLKQHLLALDSPLLRLELIGDILDRTELSF